ncbi:hypothetical protein BRADI_2g45102v3 [Brachypodium distachyon]|uniref:Uncharacterized protein n=1 Tax=Brachypodium distachyon TaxID=15368 RepID=A0A0Q3GCM2_BRADI|nr:hypothetical protein BRADI_2g45102v3 [Brachypodium distachyon]
MTGIGTTEGTKETRTTATNSSANILQKSRTQTDNGFVKSPRMLIGIRIGVVYNFSGAQFSNRKLSLNQVEWHQTYY